MKKVTRQKTVVQDYNVYIAKDGKEFTSEDECINYEKIQEGSRMVCPECNGKKGWQGKWIEPYEHWDGPMGGYYEWHECPRCKGKGYLDKVISWK